MKLPELRTDELVRIGWRGNSPHGEYFDPNSWAGPVAGDPWLDLSQFAKNNKGASFEHGKPFRIGNRIYATDAAMVITQRCSVESDNHEPLRLPNGKAFKWHEFRGCSAWRPLWSDCKGYPSSPVQICCGQCDEDVEQFQETYTLSGSVFLKSRIDPFRAAGFCQYKVANMKIVDGEHQTLFIRYGATGCAIVCGIGTKSQDNKN